MMSSNIFVLKYSTFVNLVLVYYSLFFILILCYLHHVASTYKKSSISLSQDSIHDIYSLS